MHCVLFFLKRYPNISLINVRKRRGDPQPRTHADARSVFTDSVYGFMAPHLRKSKQETNASNGIPETSGKKIQAAFILCVFRRKTAVRSRSSVADVLYARNAIFTQRIVLFGFWQIIKYSSKRYIIQISKLKMKRMT